jgi:ABC-2 type transport system ATP-binding protein
MDCAGRIGRRGPKGLPAEFGLAEAASRKFAGYSKGMKRKLALAAGIIHQPRILFLDEPTTGLDVASARQVRRLIAALHQAGTTIFLTTHYIEEAERLCGRIAFIVAGRIVRTDAVADLIQPQHESQVMFLTFAEAEPAVSEKLISAFPDLVFQPISDQQIRVEALRPVRVGPLARFLEDQGAEVLEARRRQPSLEDIFVRVTGIEAEAMRKDEERMGAAHEIMDRFLEHFGQRHAGLLPQAAQHQLGVDLSAGLDRYVFHQVGRPSGRRP